MAERTHLSIGEVLSLLREEFPDVTISKIRFLESQGLLDPERTPSGYRKFYDDDVAKLRWILQQQRENFLPLKVIKDRLADGEAVPGVPGEAGVPGNGVSPGTPAAGADGPDVAARSAMVESARQEPAVVAGRLPAASAADRAGRLVQPAVPPAPAAGHAAEAVAEDCDVVSLTIDELARATGLQVDEVRQLERYGLVQGRSLGGTVYYDPDAIAAAEIAAAFRRFGIEARHLRMYKTAADREAAFYGQIVLPLIKQRNPRGRKRAAEDVEELSRLGQILRSTLLRVALRDHTGG